MPSTCRESWHRSRLGRLLVMLPHLVPLGCGKQIGYVGSVDGVGVGGGAAGSGGAGVGGGAAGSGGAGVGGGAAGSGGAGGDVFLEEFAANGGEWEIETGLPNATVILGRANAEARDRNVAELVFPGNTGASATDGAGPDYVTQIATVKRFHFGTLRSRVALGQCSSRESVVQSILGYFNDGTDSDKNGIVDDIEIDIQVPCEARRFVLLSVFTDYQESATGTQFRKLSHLVDFSSGAEYDTPSDSADRFVSSGSNPNLLRPGLLGANSFYELGFEWRPESIRFFVVDGNEDVTLWTVNDAAHVPQLPVHLMFNLWHPSEHWYPLEGSADFPARDVTMLVDWVRFESL